ncbi:MAG: YvcK family protein [Candidatus Aenigmatarchaeota archaeon]
MKRIKAIIFDLDDTLYDCYGTLADSARMRAAEAMVNAGLQVSKQEIYEAEKEIAKSFQPDLFTELKNKFNITDDKILEAGKKAYNSDDVQDIKPFEGAIEVLDELKKECKLILLTTGVHSRQEKKIKALGLGDKFDHIIINDIEVGHTKREHFIEVLSNLELDPRQIVCFGDNPFSEIEIANNLGITSIRMLHGRFKGASPTDMAKSDYEITNVKELPDLIRKIDEEDKLKIVAIGGGTGLPIILEGLKNRNIDITAIVTVTDSGRSSGVLRKELNVLPPGDIRNCLISLSNSEKLMRDLFQYRFDNGSLEGHSFGNLLITVLSKVTGSFEQSIKEVSKILQLKGKVLPSTLMNTHICAELEDGRIVEEEFNVRERNKSRIKKVFLKPENAKPVSEAIVAIREADIIIMGPGSLFTSIIPNLLVDELPEAIVNSSAKKIYVCNMMTQPGQTDNFKASEHVKEIMKYLNKTKKNGLDCVIINNKLPSTEVIESYKKEGADIVENDLEEIDKLGVNVLQADLLEDLNAKRTIWEKQDLLRHDSNKLTKTIIDYGKKNSRV